MRGLTISTMNTITRLFDFPYYQLEKNDIPAALVTKYNGEWVKIQLPVKIKLSKYIIQHGQYETTRSPSIYKIFGSNDDVAWTELHSKSTGLAASDYISSNTKKVLLQEIIITILL